MKDFDKIDNEICECKKEIERAKKHLYDLRLQRAKLEFSEKFPIGRLVIVDNNKYQIIGYIIEYGQPYVEVNKIKKDGTPSKMRQKLYSYEREKAVLVDR